MSTARTEPCNTFYVLRKVCTFVVIPFLASITLCHFFTFRLSTLAKSGTTCWCPACGRSFVDYSARETEMLILNTLHKVIPEKLLSIFDLYTGSNPVHNVTANAIENNPQSELPRWTCTSGKFKVLAFAWVKSNAALL